MSHLGWSEGESEHGDIVLLAVGLRGLGDLLRRLPADRPGALEAEQLARGIACFHHSVGEERQRVAFGQEDDITVLALTFAPAEVSHA